MPPADGVDERPSDAEEAARRPSRTALDPRTAGETAGGLARVRRRLAAWARARLRPKSLILEITLWGALLFAIGLGASLAASEWTRRATAENLADFGLVSFLEDLEQTNAECLAPAASPPAIATDGDAAPLAVEETTYCDVFRLNESNGVWRFDRGDGQPFESTGFRFFPFVDGVGDCARRNLRRLGAFEAFTCQPETAFLPYRVAVREAAGSRRAIIALEMAVWETRVAAAATHLSRWPELRLVRYVGGAVLLAALAAMLTILRGRLRAQFGRLSGQVEAFRRGEARRVRGAYASEIQSLVTRFNKAIERNDRLITRQARNVKKMAHDLRHQLVGVRLASMDEDPDALDAELETLNRLVERYLTLVDWVGPVEGGKPIAARGLLEDMRKAFSRRLREKPIDYELVCDPDLNVAAHPTDLRIVFSNLLTNAHKYADGRVRIGARRVAGGAAFWVEDDGPGVPPEARDKALGWGERLDDALPGSGFGLTIVAEQVRELYGGSVRLEDGDLGGLRVVVTIPDAGDAR